MAEVQGLCGSAFTGKGVRDAKPGFSQELQCASPTDASR